MSHINLFGQLLFDAKIVKGLKFEVNEYVPADNWALPVDSPTMLFLNPAGAVDVLMPAAAGNKGLVFIICNISANAITLKTSGDAAFTTAIVVGANECTMVICTGSATAALGWRAFATASSA